jgi:hypothetical protein
MGYTPYTSGLSDFIIWHSQCGKSGVFDVFQPYTRPYTFLARPYTRGTLM